MNDQRLHPHWPSRQTSPSHPSLPTSSHPWPPSHSHPRSPSRIQTESRSTCLDEFWRCAYQWKHPLEESCQSCQWWRGRVESFSTAYTPLSSQLCCSGTSRICTHTHTHQSSCIKHLKRCRLCFKLHWGVNCMKTLQINDTHKNCLPDWAWKWNMRSVQHSVKQTLIQ